MTSKNRINTLDAFRGIAALIVVLRHYTTIFKTNYNLPLENHFEFKYGYLGVEFFFMISGFVILLSIKKHTTASEFALKRILRLYPTYWFAILFTFSTVYITNFDDLKVSLNDLFLNLLMFQDFLSPVIEVENVDGVYWTLNVELFFYLFIAVLIYFKLLKNIKWIGLVWVLWSVLGLYYNLSIFKLGILLNYWWSPLFYAGILFYILWKSELEKKQLINHVLILISATAYIIICLMREEDPLKSNFVDALVGLLFFSLFYLFVYSKLNFLGRNKILLFLGKISYPWYLIHQNIGYIILYFLFVYLDHDNDLLILLPILVTVILAYAIHVYIEKPSYVFLKQKFLSKSR